MTQDKFKSLGRGLSSLISDKSLLDMMSPQEKTNSTTEVAIDKIIHNPGQPRKMFKDDEILELS